MKNLYRFIIFSLVLAMLIYPGLEKLYLYKQTIVLEDLVMTPIGFLGENQTIISNNDKFTRYGTKYKELDLLPNRDLFIGIKNEFLFHEKWVNLTEERERVFEERLTILKNYFYKKFYEGYYSMVVYGPSSKELDIYQVLQLSQDLIRRGLNNNKASDVDKYCRIVLPSNEHRCLNCDSGIRIFLKEIEICNEAISRINNYYGNNFVRICKSDEYFADIIVKAYLSQNGFSINANCKEGGRLLMNYNDKNIRLNDLLNVLYLSIIFLIIINLKRKKHLIVLLLCLLAIFASFIYLYKFNDGYVANIYYQNASSFIDTQVNELGFSADNVQFLKDLEDGKDFYTNTSELPDVIIYNPSKVLIRY